MKKLFLNNLPKWNKNQIGNEGTINWQKCAETKIKIQFIYNNIKDEIQIIDYNSKTRKVTIVYKNKKYFNVYTSHLIKCEIGRILGVYTSEFKIEIGKRLINYNKYNSIKRDITIIDKEYRKDKTLEIDNYKDELADEHGIKVIRIDCNCNEEYRCKYIKTSILNNNILSKLFNFNNINWLKIEEFALSNLVKKVCDYWNIKQEWETKKDLEKIFNINRFTIIRYLKNENLLDWCKYNPEEERDKNIQHNSNAAMKVVVCLNNNEIFNSIKEASEYYKINNNSISACCKGKSKSAGKHPITGEKLKWMYYSNYLKLNK